ncbi:YraN family protein [Candidatus Calescamantes bacterium]|nr:YraN family protein [Candidatus Calescamantes bacterium]
MNKRAEGKKYEKIARTYLQQRGWTIIEENYIFGHKEVDLIAVKAEELCFIEVKFRYSPAYGKGFEFVDSRKKNNVMTAAKGFLAKRKGYRNFNVTFGIVSITGEEIDFRRGYFKW